MNGTQLEFTLPTVPGQFYQLEYKSDLSITNWTPSAIPSAAQEEPFR
jgi:hypothetical protein